MAFVTITGLLQWERTRKVWARTPASHSSFLGLCAKSSRAYVLERDSPHIQDNAQSSFMVLDTDSNETNTLLGEEMPSVPFSPKGMTVEEFFSKSFGDWKSQRSSHNLAWGQFEAITSDIKIESRNNLDEDVVNLCAQYNVSLGDVLLSFAMSWEGESDWNDEEVLSGSTLMSVTKDGPSNGRLIRSSGYAETVPAVGHWEMTPDGVFVLSTSYEAAAAEERIWFATPDLRMRVSQIRTSSGRGVVTASFATEIRRLNSSS